MDKFVTVVRKKESKVPTATQKRCIKGLREMIMGNHVILVFGDAGVGKTFIVKKALAGLSYIDLEKPQDFPESTAHLVLDDVEFEGDPPRSLGSTIVVSKKFTHGYQSYYEIPSLPEKELVQIAHEYFDGDIESGGATNIRTFLTDLDFSGDRDAFPTPKEFVTDLLCSNKIDKWSHAGHVVMEHGYSFGIVHENYLDAKGDPLRLCEWMSLADTQDDYAKSAAFFSFLGIIAPSILLKGSLKPGDIRPGSSWTKFNNYKMRSKKFASMSRKIPVDIDSLSVLNQYCVKGDSAAIDCLRAYGLTSSDLDVMNHLMMSKKMKPKVLAGFKKQLKDLTS
jgi:hypothetical protein